MEPVRDECAKFAHLGRLHDLCCGGCQHGPTPPIEDTNRFRVRHGLQPLPVQTAEMPSLIVRGINLTVAAWRHAMNGFKCRSEPEIERLLEVCRGCPEFTGRWCQKCGCNCGGNETFLNKLAWQSERCPLGKWQ